MAAKDRIPYSTARGWVLKSEVDPNPRGNVAHETVTGGHVEPMLHRLGEKSRLTLKHLTEKLSLEFGASISTTTIGNHLEERMFSVNRVNDHPINMNSHRNKEARKQYVD